MSAVSIEKQGAVAILKFDRPDSKNALGLSGDGAEIQTACSELAADAALRCIVITGTGNCFSAGGDVKAMWHRTGSFAGGGTDIRAGYRENIHVGLRALYALDLPVVAAVNGPAIGLGCDIACLADIRIASDQATFGVTFLKLGLIPGDGGTWLLPRIVGWSRAAEMFFTGEVVGAQEALRIGLVSRLAPAAELLNEAMTIARRIAEQPPHALRLTKSLLRQAHTITYDTALELAAANQAIAHLTTDHRERLSALIERRKTSFTGN